MLVASLSLFFSLSVAQVLVGLRKQFMKNIVLPLGPVLLVIIVATTTTNNNNININLQNTTKCRPASLYLFLLIELIISTVH